MMRNQTISVFVTGAILLVSTCAMAEGGMEETEDIGEGMAGMLAEDIVGGVWRSADGRIQGRSESGV